MYVIYRDIIQILFTHLNVWWKALPKDGGVPFEIFKV